MGSEPLRLAPITEADLPTLFAFESDPVASQMADFPSRDEVVFYQHWQQNVIGVPEAIAQGIWLQDKLIGSMLSWYDPKDRLIENSRLIGYWIGREYWGQGIATQALALFLPLLPKEPLFAYVAAHNIGSLKVIKRYGFIPAALTAEQAASLPEGLGLYKQSINKSA
ncbi:GNAT family N-acetyltransferase [Shewanella sp. OMA3-2]|uniref:GNAT family N-acetyltransferase n=1 Tax=Shewanella sp. OMA3-2 TaxID=2908650 RepID=UPI001F2FE06A|nr:GNAT family N-acetyltransferase [Shewanella sp. OMA3-2]UJF22660.1 GNAT family N-acetyltransferase [Shewanella sp. OMA3-2]